MADDAQRCTEPLAPYQYELVWVVMREPLSASEIASTWPARDYLQYNDNPILATANRLRPLVRRGWIERSPQGIYRATEKARASVSW